MPKRATIKPVLQIRTNTAGMAVTHWDSLAELADLEELNVHAP